MAADPPSRAPDPSADELLPQESHLAGVVEDAVEEIDASTPGDQDRAPYIGLIQAMLYGWACGVLSSRDLAIRGSSESNFRHLLGGQPLDFQVVRAFREEQQDELEVFYAAVFEMLVLSGFSRLGRIALPVAVEPSDVAVACRRLARELLSSAAAADLREDRELGESTRGDELPVALVERGQRQSAFRETRASRSLSGGPALRPGRRARPPQPTMQQSEPVAAPSDHVAIPVPSAGRGAPKDILAVIATMAIVFVGLVFVRWLAASSAPAVAETRPAPPPVAFSAPFSVPASEPGADGRRGRDPNVELGEARDAALRLAAEALSDDNDLSTARDLYFLAVQAVPDDEEAADRLRQVETALGIASRRTGWDDAVFDLAELRTVAPGSSAVLQAYVTALVGAGRAAIAARDPERANNLCSEALRWFPQRDDARSCLLLAGGGPPTPTTNVLTPQALAAIQTPGAAPTLTVLGPATPIPLSLPGGMTLPTPLARVEPLQVNVNGSCTAGADGSGTIRLNGGVASATGPVPSYHLSASAIPPVGGIVPIANTTYLTPIFGLQQQVDTPGTYVVTVSATKDGFMDGQASVRISC